MREETGRKGIGIGRAPGLLLLAAGIGLAYGAAVEFYNMAWGTGAWLGEFSFKWALGFALFIVFCILCLISLAWAVRRKPGTLDSQSVFIRMRRSLGPIRWVVAALFLVAPVWFLQYSPWGVAIGGPFLRVLIWCLSAIGAGFWMTSRPDTVISWWSLLSATLMVGAGCVVAAAFADVTSYPFSLGWSEGNRLWDYSLLFGLRLYSYPPGQRPVAYLDIGRQFAGGLPFLLPQVSIFGERMWLSVLSVLPYVLLSLLAFWPSKARETGPWIVAGILGFIFLAQGPIHSPLLFCAMLVAIAWRQPTWLAASLVLVASILAEVSRFTWMFAAAMWMVMLEIAGSRLAEGRIPAVTWRRTATIGLSGLLGIVVAIVAGLSIGGASLGAATGASTRQPLLWYRLLPNATYGYGILLGLVIATAPLILVLILVAARRWRPNILQRLAICLPLAAFLFVGLVVSTKIGGGGDLHNLDMFLIGLLFVAALEWRAVGAQWLADRRAFGSWMRALLVALVALPAFGSLMVLRPLSFARDADWLAVLADVERARDLGSLPDEAVIGSSLQELQNAVEQAQKQGEVLFMDQRQLLTFGYVKDVTLVSDYEKKRMMDEALGANAAYFAPFYRDLAAHRFSLIITSPLRTPIRDSDYGFGEENNAWVHWVARPVLCYYQEQDTLNEVKVQLLVPRVPAVDCAPSLP